MTRRDFLALLAAVPVLRTFVPIYRPSVRLLEWGTRNAYQQVQTDGTTYQYVQARNELRKGDLVYCGSDIVGVAVGAISPGNYGFIHLTKSEATHPFQVGHERGL
jgi:hypothetical protein